MPLTFLDVTARHIGPDHSKTHKRQLCAVSVSHEAIRGVNESLLITATTRNLIRVIITPRGE